MLEQPQFRKLTNEEIVQYADRVINQRSWSLVREYVQKWYGESAHQIVIKTHNEYNDQDYDWEIYNITVSDINGNELRIQPTPELDILAEADFENHLKWIGRMPTENELRWGHTPVTEEQLKQKVIREEANKSMWLEDWYIQKCHEGIYSIPAPVRINDVWSLTHTIYMNDPNPFELYVKS